MGYYILWRYRVRPEHASAFEAAYGPRGVWARLFQRSAGFLGTDLLSDAGSPGVYVTIDRWRTQHDYDAVLREHIDEYTRLDRDCDVLTLSEERIGGFVSEADIGAPRGSTWRPI